MKKQLLYTLFIPLFAAFTACSEGMDSDNSPYAEGMGGLNIKNSTSTDITIPVITKSADFSDIEVNNFYVGILDKQGSVVKEFDTFAALIDSGLPVILSHGDYSVVASSYKAGNIKVSENPYFVDEQNFIIEEKKTTNLELTCRYKSLGVELNLSDQFKALLENKPNDYAYEVTVSNGVAEWKFSTDQMKPGYFLDNCKELVVKVRVRLGSDQWYPERTYRIMNDENTPATSPKLGEYYIIRLDAGEEEEAAYSLKSIALTEKE